jgi:hypothetical protein
MPPPERESADSVKETEMSFWKHLAVLAVSWPLVGCAYIDVSMPLDTDLAHTELGSKVGRSQMHCVAGAVCWGDAGTQAAAREGGLRQLNHADREVFVVLLGLYARQTTVVYGE